MSRPTSEQINGQMSKEALNQQSSEGQPEQIRVLLSFNSEYAHIAQQLAADLGEANIEVIYDQWRGGDGITASESVEKTLEKIAFVIPILTPSEASPVWLGEAWKQRIYDQALRQNIDVLPVLGAACKPPKFLKGLSYANLVNQHYGFEVERLVRTIGQRSGNGHALKVLEPESLAGDMPSPLALPSKQILIEVGEALAPFFEDDHEDGNVDNNNGARFFCEQIPMMRDGLFYELGVTFPSVTVQTATALPHCAARVLLNGVPESQVEIKPNAVMVNTSVEEMEQQGFEATAVTNPASGISCAWIPISKRNVVEEAGLTTWDTQGFVILWLAAVLRRKAASFIGVNETQAMLNQLAPVFPQLVAETVPKAVSLFLLTDVLRRLVVEGVSIRNLPKILLSLAEWGRVERDPLFLTEYVRAALKRQLTHTLTRGTQTFVVFLLAPDIEDLVRASLEYTPTGSYLNLAPEDLSKLLDLIHSAMDNVPQNAQVPQLLTTMEIRSSIRRLVALAMPRLHVISYQELRADSNIQPLGRISLKGGVEIRTNSLG